MEPVPLLDDDTIPLTSTCSIPFTADENVKVTLFAVSELIT